MFRNQFDTDCITWSPAGRIHQIEYAMEAVNVGSAAIGLRSAKHVVVATLKRSTSELSSYQKKVFKIDDNVGIAIAGLVADARVLAKYMRTECINHRYVYDEPMQVRGMRAQGIGRAQRDGRLTGAKRQAQMQPIDTGKSRWGRHLWI